MCFPCHSSLTATKNIFSPSESLCLTPPPNPPPFLCASQVWYLSGWVCYLQLEKAKEQQEREGRDVTEEETEEWKALKEAARTYLTNAKKVNRVTKSAHKQNYHCYLLMKIQDSCVSALIRVWLIKSRLIYTLSQYFHFIPLLHYISEENVVHLLLYIYLKA